MTSIPDWRPLIIAALEQGPGTDEQIEARIVAEAPAVAAFDGASTMSPTHARRCRLELHRMVVAELVIAGTRHRGAMVWKLAAPATETASS